MKTYKGKFRKVVRLSGDVTLQMAQCAKTMKFINGFVQNFTKEIRAKLDQREAQIEVL